MDLREILDRVELSDKMGVCMDPCHVWKALRDLPFCLETPDELPGYAEEIHFLKEHRQ